MVSIPAVWHSSQTKCPLLHLVLLLIFLWQTAHSMRSSLSRYTSGALHIRHSSFIVFFLRSMDGQNNSHIFIADQNAVLPSGYLSSVSIIYELSDLCKQSKQRSNQFGFSLCFSDIFVRCNLLAVAHLLRNP